jgi:hypothetical protein
MKIITFVEDLLDLASANIMRSWLFVFLAGSALALAAGVLHVGMPQFTGLLKPGLIIAGQAAAGEVQVKGLATGAKQVGFWYAPNWAFYCALILPFIIAFCLKIRAEMEPTLRRMAKHGLVRDAAFARVSEDAFIARWRRQRRIDAIFPMIVFLMVVVFAYWDYWTTVASPILAGVPQSALHLDSPTYEYDWSVSCLFAGNDVVGGCGANLTFDALAYLLSPALGAGLVFAAMIDAALFIAFASGFTMGEDWRLTAYPDDADDALCGFKVFEPFFSALLAAALVILPSLILVIVQNNYLRDATSADVFAFLGADWDATVKALLDLLNDHKLSPFLAALTTSRSGPPLTNPDNAFSVFVFIFVVAASLGSSWILLRLYAEAAQDFADDHLPKLAKEIGASRAVLEKRLDAMKFWPLGWMSINDAGAAVFVMGLAILSYRLAFLPIVLAIFLVVIHMLRRWAAATGLQLLPGHGGGAPARRRRRSPRAAAEPEPIPTEDP